MRLVSFSQKKRLKRCPSTQLTRSSLPTHFLISLLRYWTSILLESSTTSHASSPVTSRMTLSPRSSGHARFPCPQQEPLRYYLDSLSKSVLSRYRYTDLRSSGPRQPHAFRSTGACQAQPSTHERVEEINGDPSLLHTPSRLCHMSSHPIFSPARSPGMPPPGHRRSRP